MPRDKRQKRDLHALDGDGMVLCNPRDKEAAHRAQMEDIATDDRNAVTCRKCLSLLSELRQANATVVQGGVAEAASRPGFTRKEGQYLAFIYHYAKLNRRAPAEHDMQVYFQVTPPAVHSMVLKLEKRRFISREPGAPRSIRLLLSRDQLPDLE
jgi:DNA-binding MarR family transcriptional regulator